LPRAENQSGWCDDYRDGGERAQQGTIVIYSDFASFLQPEFKHVAQKLHRIFTVIVKTTLYWSNKANLIA
jgi:hypothetical protein